MIYLFCSWCVRVAADSSTRSVFKSGTKEKFMGMRVKFTLCITAAGMCAPLFFIVH